MAQLPYKSVLVMETASGDKLHAVVSTKTEEIRSLSSNNPKAIVLALVEDFFSDDNESYWHARNLLLAVSALGITEEED